jgi:hypothetical protein
VSISTKWIPTEEPSSIGIRCNRLVTQRIRLLGSLPISREPIQTACSKPHQVKTYDRVAVLNSIRGTHQGEFIGLKPSGRSIDAMAFQLYRIENGQVAEHWEVADFALFVRQLQG